MIVNLFGKYVNPEQIAFLEYSTDGTGTILALLTNGRYVTLPRKYDNKDVALHHVQDAINEALFPRKIVLGDPAVDSAVWGAGPMFALPTDDTELIDNLAALIETHEADLRFCQSTANKSSGKTVAAANHERIIRELRELLLIARRA